MTEPKNAKAPGATEADATNQSTSTEIIGSTADQCKRWANLQARAALAGIAAPPREAFIHAGLDRLRFRQ